MKVLLLHVFPLLCTASIHYPSHTFPLEVAKQQNHKQDRLETEVQLADQAAEGSTDVATTIIIPAKRPIRRNRVRTIKSLLNSFPFRQQVRHHPAAALTRQQDSALTRQQDSVLTRQQDSVLTQLAAAETDPETGRRCVDKVMLREETEYDEILTCDHSYDNRCHTSYVTRYEPVQEQHCDEKFRKVCTIDYEQKALQELVEVCTTPFVPDCEEEGEEECRTVYESECITQQVVHQVEDDVANCQTEQEEKCMEVTEGFTTRQQCDTWPVERCKLEKKLVQKYTPKTACQKVPKEMCAPAGCGIKEGPVQCQDRVKTVIVDNPVEECDMEPLRTCKHITKLVPKLEPTQECVDVPKEICARSKVNPRKVKKPSIQKWCFVPEQKQNTSLECSQDQDCSPGTFCTQGTCLEGLTNGWQLVRHTPPTHWHPATDQMRGTEVYGTPGDENATLAWSTGWDLSDVDRFMFASVDLQFWLIVKKVDIVGEDGNLYYNNGEVAIVASSSNPEPHTARWYRRNGSKEDPWVSLGDHPRGCLYGGNKYGAHQDKLQAGGGMNVYIQKMT